MNRIIIIFFIMVSSSANAKWLIDIYGDRDRKIDKILIHYYDKIEQIEHSLQQLGLKKFPSTQDSELFKQILVKKILLSEELRSQLKLSYLSFDTIYYPESSNYYTTIEVISPNTPSRLKFLTTNQTKDETSNSTRFEQSNLIDQELAYEAVALDLIINHQLSSKVSHCSAFHCSWGFNHPKLKPYLAIFNKGAKQQKNLILQTLRSHINPQRRTAAALLVGHFNNPQAIITTLLPHVRDKDASVRNMVIRVIGATMSVAHIYKVDSAAFIELLASPYATDRNKSLYVLEQISHDPASHRQLINNAGRQLIDLLQLKQPNNHDIAYAILKKVSRRNLGENDIQGWKHWLMKQHR
ncbi:MAG: HEAT repeat domain-containing protein [Legionella sp.]